jgi:hypothetical protein
LSYNERGFASNLLSFHGRSCRIDGHRSTHQEEGENGLLSCLLAGSENRGRKEAEISAVLFLQIDSVWLCWTRQIC